MKFELNEKEAKAAQKFMKQKGKDKSYTGAIGGRFSIEFTITGLGNAVVIKDAVTKTEKNITDYDMW